MNKNGGFRTPERVNEQLNHAGGVFNNSQKKPLRYSKDSFTRELLGKHIRMKTTSNEIFDGTLKEIGMFDVFLEAKSTETYNINGKTMTKDVTKNIIFLKGQIVWIEVI